MAGQRQPGSWTAWTDPESLRSSPSCRIQTPPPGRLASTAAGASHQGETAHPVPSASLRTRLRQTLDDLNKAVADFQRSESWFTLQPVVSRLLGQYSFGLGVVYGIGENVVTSVVELVRSCRHSCLRTCMTGRVSPCSRPRSTRSHSFSASWPKSPCVPSAGSSSEAHREREALIDELRYAMTHIGERPRLTSRRATSRKNFAARAKPSPPWEQVAGRCARISSGLITGSTSILSRISDGFTEARLAHEPAHRASNPKTPEPATSRICYPRIAATSRARRRPR